MSVSSERQELSSVSSSTREYTATETELRSFFDMFDCGHTEGISRKSAEHIGKILGLKLGNEHFETIVSFEKLFAAVSAAEESMTVQEQASRCYDFIQQDTEGYVDSENLRHFLQSVDLYISKEDANRVSQSISRQSDDLVFSKDDFVHFLTQANQRRQEQFATDSASSQLTHSLIHDDFPDD